jgi:PmbA protein
MPHQKLADHVLSIAKSSSAECQVEISKSFVKELSIEASKINLLRTNHDQSVSVKIYRDQKFAAGSGNQFSLDAVSAATKTALASAEAAPQDVAHVIVENQGVESFDAGISEANDQWAIERFQSLLKTIKSRFPKLILENSIISYKQKEVLLASTQGTRLLSRQGTYDGFLMFTTKDGGKSSSFNYMGFVLGKPELQNANFDLMDFGGLEMLLKQSTEQTDVKKIPAKFEGDVIVTPHCIDSLLHPLLEHLGTESLLTKTSLFQDKLGQKVVSEKFSLTANPILASNNHLSFWTSDGIKAQNESIFSAGVLDRYLLGQYGSQKLNQKVSRSGGYCLAQKCGDVALDKMISSVHQGVLMSRISAGSPASNGDFSGVAKNSYYIEKGKILYPLGETMISGNLLTMFNNIKDVSQESLFFGAERFPWTRFGGMVVS